MCILRLFLISPLSYSPLAISQYSLILKQIGWVQCLKIFMYALLELKDSSTPPIIKSNYASRPLRISQMLFSKSQRAAFSYSCQKGGEHIVRGRATKREVCIVNGGVVCSRGEKLSYTLTHSFGHITYLWLVQLISYFLQCFQCLHKLMDLFGLFLICCFKTYVML